MRSVFRLIFLYMDVQLFMHQFVEDYLFSIELPFFLCQGPTYISLSLGEINEYSISLIYMSILSLIPCLLDYCCYIVLKSVGISSSILFSVLYGYPRCPIFPYKLESRFLGYWLRLRWMHGSNRRIDILTILSLPIYQHRLSLCLDIFKLFHQSLMVFHL